VRADRDVEREPTALLTYVDEVLPTLINEYTDFSEDPITETLKLFAEVYQGDPYENVD